MFRHSTVLTIVILLGGIFSSGCAVADYAVRKGSEVVETKLDNARKEKYLALKNRLAEKGIDITEVDGNEDGEVTIEELTPFFLANPSVLGDYELLFEILGLLGLTLGWRTVRKFSKK